MPTKWALEETIGDPRFCVGWRANKSLQVKRLELHQDVFEDFRKACVAPLGWLKSQSSRPYEPFAALESGEQFFELPIDATLQEGIDQSELVAAIQGVDQLASVSPEELRSKKVLFYAICWKRTNGGFLGFVTKDDPQVVLKPGYRYFQYADTLKHVDHPDLMIKDKADLVISPTEIAAFSAAALKDLLSDIHLVFTQVDSKVAEIKGILSSTLPLSDDSTAALVAVGRAKLSVARRLHVLKDRLSAIETDPTKFRKYLRDFGYDPDSFLDKKKNLVFGHDLVERFLDFVEGRFYRDELGDEPRRADRYSNADKAPRSKKPPKP
jgi:hypothetical protein